MQKLVEKVKLALRLTTDTFDDEIRDKLEEAGEEMRRVGIDETVQTGTALGRAASIAYCRSEYAGDVNDRAKFREAFENMLDNMRRSALYRAEGGDRP